MESGIAFAAPAGGFHVVDAHHRAVSCGFLESSRNAGCASTTASDAVLSLSDALSRCAVLVSSAAAVSGLMVGGRRHRWRRQGVQMGAAKMKRKPRWAPGGGSLTDEKLATIGDDMQAERDDMLPAVVKPGNGRCFRVTFEYGIGIREGDTINSPRTGEDLKEGEVFEVKTEVQRGARRYFELLDGRGWVFDWIEVDGERVELVELAARLYTMAFPQGVFGIEWFSETTMNFTSVGGFYKDGMIDLVKAGLTEGDVLVMIDEDPVVGLPFAQVLERLWATGGRQPGSGTFYRVVTEGPYGIGIRQNPDINGARTGEDLIRGSVFEVDKVLEGEDGLTYLHLADNRGWVFDNRKRLSQTEQPCVEKIGEADVGCTLTLWRGSKEDLATTLGLNLTLDYNAERTHKITVLEGGAPTTQIVVPTGANLRAALLKNKYQVFDQMRGLFHCNANQLCGTCQVDVMKGVDNLTPQSVNEKTVMALNPPGFRLACNAEVWGDITVRLRPPEARGFGETG
eukprot:TRINITY_DN3150_c0_g1_i2.p1 TRINITY_DN3150_c0_g1~~TRINITY_DN3150_c0_g1_i2.p1  ORF type:complete len:512 (-),score=97.97 TRINITY_DN3150_c0_g1_i2:505-2040(-)